MTLTSRPTVDGDLPFLLDLYAANRSDEFSLLGWTPEALRSFLEQQYRARQVAWGLTAPAADDRVLVRDGCPVGRLVLDRRAEGVRVVDIAVVPEEQGRGIGTTVLRRVLDEAEDARLPVTLHVVAASRARRLYERLGFRTLREDGVHVLMGRTAGQAPETSRRAEGAAVQPNTAT
ncbi:GNAT family N-acetyltransferase [Oryzobacter sp. R7]|uniref:GNAT family N-acetyltransferase n=1 Tax=Oryzobacter faecalis TaxID=3388656 RepID=UPI00398D50F8